MTTTMIANAAAAYANASKNAAAGLAPRESGGSFSQLLEQAASGTVEALKQGEAASIGAVTGNANLTDVVTAVSNAEMVLQTVTAVRDRVIQAYQDIIRMPI